MRMPNVNQACVMHTPNVNQVCVMHAPNVNQSRVMHTPPVTEHARPHKTARTMCFINLPRLTSAKITVIMGKETAGEAWGGFKMRKGDEARHTLLCRAAELFDARGYDAVSIKDIADSLGWAKSLFYYYFPSKEQLVMHAAQTRATEIMDGLRPKLEAAGSGVERLSRALGCMGFWASGDAREAARLLGTLYADESLPWRVYLRAALTPMLAYVCNDIIECGVKEYEMYTPYPREMALAALDMTADLAERLAKVLCAGGSDAPSRACALLDAYRCALERLVEAPFGSLRVVELELLRDAALELGVSFGGGDIDEEVVLEEKDAGAAGGAGDDEPDCTGGGD